MHGFGRFEGAEGDMYEGEFEMDVKHGTGIMQMNSGAR